MDIRPLILAVDDDAHILQIIKWELTSQGCQVVTCRSGEEALDIAREQRPELIILDVLLPALDGFEVLRRLRERTAVPVILLTAKTRDQDKIGGLDTGADDYVTKPFSPEELSARVKAILRRGPREDAAESTVIRNGNVEIDLGRRRPATPARTGSRHRAHRARGSPEPRRAHTSTDSQGRLLPLKGRRSHDAVTATGL
jgi:DNA-binding response OmpR family regulator